MGFERLGIQYFPSQANFVLFQAGDRAIPIRDALRDRGVLVRDRSYEIPGCVRVTIGTRAQVERFFTELETLWKRVDRVRYGRRAGGGDRILPRGDRADRRTLHRQARSRAT